MRSKIRLIIFRILMKSHLLKCSQKNKNYEIEHQLTATPQGKQSRCLWASCSSVHFDNAETAAAHMSNHITADAVHCQWGPCTFNASTPTDLHAHVTSEHSVYT
jgi:hypothetical protein